MPAQFTALQDTGFIAISGPDQRTFLQGQLSCDVNQVTNDQSQLGLYCNIQGRVVASFRLFPWQDSLLLMLPQEQVTATMACLQKYAMFSKITLNVMTDLQAFGIFASSLDTVLTTLDMTLPENINGISRFSKGLAIRLPSHMQRAILIIDSKNAQQSLATVATATTLDGWHCHALQAGIATIYSRTAGQFLPHNINFHRVGAISFNKGCYLGQEIIARMHYRGQLKYQLFGFTVDTAISLIRGSDIVAVDIDKTIGQIVDYAQCEQGGVYVLASLYTDTTSPIPVSINQQQITIRPAAL